MNDDILKVIFSHTAFLDYPSLFRVCTHWNSCLTQNIDDLFWRPLYNEMFPKKLQANHIGPTHQFQAIVKTLLQNHRKEIDYIVSQMNNDDVLAKCLHSDAWKLEDFNTKPAFERCQLMWKALFVDATPILVHLINGYTAKCEARENRGFNGFNRLQDILSFYRQLQSDDQSLPIVLSLIEKHKVPFDKIEIICALMPINDKDPKAMAIICIIIKAHQDLSKLKGRNYREPSGLQNSIVASLWMISRIGDWSMDGK